MAGRDRTFAAPPLLLQTRLLLGCANLHALDRHWMPYRHAAGTGPTLGLVRAGLACENQQSGRVHLEPNLQAVAAPLSGCVRHSPHLWIQYNSMGREGGVVCLERIYARAHTHSSSEDGGVAGFGAGQRGCSEHTRGAPSSAGAGLGAAGAARWRVAGQAGDGAAMARAHSEHAAHKARNWRHGMLLSRCPRAPGYSPDLCRRPCPPGRPGPAAASRCFQRGALQGVRTSDAWRVVHVAAGRPTTAAGSITRFCFRNCFCPGKLFSGAHELDCPSCIGKGGG